VIGGQKETHLDIENFVHEDECLLLPGPRNGRSGLWPLTFNGLFVFNVSVYG